MKRRDLVQERSGPQCAACDDAPAALPVADPGLRGLLQYWLELCDGRRLPDRRDFDPTCVAPVLPYFWILRLEPESGRWRFALAGERTLSLLGRKLVGESIEDVFPEQAGAFRATIDAVVSGPAVLHMAGPMYRAGRDPVRAERLALPMCDGGRLDRIYGATVYRWPSSTPGAHAQFQNTVEPTVVPVAALFAGRLRTA